MASSTTILPMFPLGLVPFPSVGLNLHIFEPRYRELIADIIESEGTFGIPPVIDNNIQSMGTEMKLISVEKRYEDGKLDIKTGGIGKFRIVKFISDYSPKLYSAAEIERVSDDYEGKDHLYDEIIAGLISLYDVFKVEKNIPKNDGSLISYGLASLAGLNIDQEYELLNFESEDERLRFILNHLKSFLPAAQEMEEMRKKIEMNGHFRDLTTPGF